MLTRRTLLQLLGAALAQPGAEPDPALRAWTVDGVTRSALVAAPSAARTRPSPLVFVFHGHGGTMRHAARSFHLHRLWPEAVVVYPQGLPTPGILTDAAGRRPGWQARVGGQKDRDLKFFDAMLVSLRRDYRIDGKRTYSTGHSNGGAFTYLLWANRADTLAALAPSSAVDAPSALKLRPKPVFHIAGERDQLVKIEWQQRMIERLRRLNGCGEGRPWAPHCTVYPSPSGTPVLAMVHPGTHAFPREAPALIVRFFKEH